MATSYINDNVRDGVWDEGEPHTTWDANDKGQDAPADEGGSAPMTSNSAGPGASDAPTPSERDTTDQDGSA